jgi:hypothetical protein
MSCKDSMYFNPSKNLIEFFIDHFHSKSEIAKAERNAIGTFLINATYQVLPINI